uniref:Replication protein A C-terminal domain-containing protein n=1 Tax=Timspurckia oligopyrenoides TaxID=708627 RepID=A0A7S0ZHX2_9RHOD|mmetsp:Transcript_5974/g.10604  ORF Transcript_5974/g.10604 Transcript_5974/m.10604 type:complete len:334 (+) Transcript_5974:77-1078(+)|eukprot:CAMPEP_0182444350 /NCGR_PEP_ID=MMETSP1172-20130603/2829_1 /TAXON_ID=708627 /ORGANISM="Timspurckia oligopyrenoides, Strain CCMP3278" /LENGTH=333 /DNA_ID=CAMNT_0024639887 /DNA_START=33 /DNA_END=1034 /DNA_ORIENTATION=-
MNAGGFGGGAGYGNAGGYGVSGGYAGGGGYGTGGGGYGAGGYGDVGGGYLGSGGGGYGADAGGGAVGSGAGGGSEQRRQQTCTPVTIKMILEADNSNGDESFTVNDVVLNQVTCVANIAAVEPLSTNITITLNDFTGSIVGNLWSNNYEETHEMEDHASVWTPGKTVRFFGTIQSMEGVRTVRLSRIMPVTDFNEITFHRLDVIREQLRVTKGLASSGMKNSTGLGMPQAAVGGYPTNVGPVPQFGGAVAINNPSMLGAGFTGNGMSPVQDAVMNMITVKSGSNPNGVYLEDIANELRSKFPRADVQAALEFLQSEGHIYNTISEQHFQPCGS